MVKLDFDVNCDEYMTVKVLLIKASIYRVGMGRGRADLCGRKINLTS